MTQAIESLLRIRWKTVKDFLRIHAFPLAIGLILLSAFVLRVYHLGTKVIWYDEADSIASVSRSFSLIQDKEILYKPLYFLILKFWIFLGQDVSPFYVRFPSVIFAVVSVYILCLICRELFDKYTALVASILLALSPFHIYYSQQVRHFSLFVMGELLSVYCLLMYLRSPSRVLCLLSVISSWIVLLIYPTGVYFIIGACVFVLWRRPPLFHLWVLGVMALLIPFVCIIVFFIFPQLQEFLVWMPQPSWQVSFEALSMFLTGGQNFGLGPGVMIRENFDLDTYTVIRERIALFLALSLLISGVMGLWLSRRKSGIIVVWAFIIMLAMIGVYMCKVSFFVVKHLIIFLPFFYVIVAFGLRRVSVSFLRLGVYFLIVGLSFLSLRNYYNYDLNINWKHAANLVKDNMKFDDGILITTHKEIAPFLYYFRTGKTGMLSDVGYWGIVEERRYKTVFFEQQHPVLLIKEQFIPQDLPAQLLSLMTSKRIWVCASIWVPDKDQELIKDFVINHEYQLKMDTVYRGVVTRLFVREEGESSDRVKEGIH